MHLSCDCYLPIKKSQHKELASWRFGLLGLTEAASFKNQEANLQPTAVAGKRTLLDGQQSVSTEAP